MGYRAYFAEDLLRPCRVLSASVEAALRSHLALSPYDRRYFNGARDLCIDDELSPVMDADLIKSTNVILTDHHLIYLLKTSFSQDRLYTFETHVERKGIVPLPPIHLQHGLRLMKNQLSPTCDLQELQHKLRVQVMLQAKTQRGARTIKASVSTGILDLTTLDIFEDLMHSFHTGNRHGTLSKRLTGDELRSTLGFDSFTAALPIGVSAADLDGAHIAVIKCDAETPLADMPLFAYNPTAMVTELTFSLMWFSSVGNYEGGAKRPDPPPDGRQYVYHIHNRKWLLAGSGEGNDGPASATEMCAFIDGDQPHAFL